jgi:hypothetical protein
MASLIVLSNNIGPVWVLFVIGLIVCIGIYRYLNSRRYRVGNAMAKQDFTVTHTVQDGDFVKIKGEVWDGGEKITAPLSRRSCAYYHVLVERQSSGKNRNWITEVEEEMMADLVLKCGNTYVVIESDSPLTHLIADRQYSSGFLEDAGPEMESFLRKNGSSSTTWIGMNRTMRYKEGILEKGEKVAVAGTARWISTSGLKFHLPVDKALLISEIESKGVFISDDPSLVNRV